MASARRDSSLARQGRLAVAGAPLEPVDDEPGSSVSQQRPAARQPMGSARLVRAAAVAAAADRTESARARPRPRTGIAVVPREPSGTALRPQTTGRELEAVDASDTSEPDPGEIDAAHGHRRAADPAASILEPDSSSEASSAAAVPAVVRLRLKCYFRGEIRVVALFENTSFRALMKRLEDDYGFPVTLRYQDQEGDLILLSSQNDLRELIELYASQGAGAGSAAFAKVQVTPSLASDTPDSLPGPGVAPGTVLHPIPASASAIATAPIDTSGAGGGTAPRLVPLSTDAAGSLVSRRADAALLAPASTAAVPGRAVLPTRRTRDGGGGAEASAPGPGKMRFQRGEMIGQGAMGTVYVGLNQDTGELIAVKQIDRATLSSSDLASLEQEVLLLRSFQHPNIVRYLGADHNDEFLFIFLEHVPGGSLRSMLNRFGPLDEWLIRVFTRQLLLGLEYLHRNGVAHRDIKCGNVLVTNEGVIKVADFGASKKFAGPRAAVSGTGVKGTPQWMAPETIKEQQNARGWRRADIWSVGCTVIEMATGKPPWPQFSNPVTAMYHIAMTDSPPDFPDHLSRQAHDFLRLCLQIEPEARPDVSALLLHPWVRDARPAGSHLSAGVTAASGALGSGAGPRAGWAGAAQGTSRRAELPARPSTGHGVSHGRRGPDATGVGALAWLPSTGDRLVTSDQRDDGPVFVGVHPERPDTGDHSSVPSRENVPFGSLGSPEDGSWAVRPSTAAMLERDVLESMPDFASSGTPPPAPSAMRPPPPEALPGYPSFLHSSDPTIDPSSPEAPLDDDHDDHLDDLFSHPMLAPDGNASLLSPIGSVGGGFSGRLRTTQHSDVGRPRSGRQSPLLSSRESIAKSQAGTSLQRAASPLTPPRSVPAVPDPRARAVAPTGTSSSFGSVSGARSPISHPDASSDAMDSEVVGFGNGPPRAVPLSSAGLVAASNAAAASRLSRPRQRKLAPLRKPAQPPATAASAVAIPNIAGPPPLAVASASLTTASGMSLPGGVVGRSVIQPATIKAGAVSGAPRFPVGATTGPGSDSRPTSPSSATHVSIAMGPASQGGRRTATARPATTMLSDKARAAAIAGLAGTAIGPSSARAGFHATGAPDLLQATSDGSVMTDLDPDAETDVLSGGADSRAKRMSLGADVADEVGTVASYRTTADQSLAGANDTLLGGRGLTIDGALLTNRSRGSSSSGGPMQSARSDMKVNPPVLPSRSSSLALRAVETTPEQTAPVTSAAATAPQDGSDVDMYSDDEWEETVGFDLLPAVGAASDDEQSSSRPPPQPMTVDRLAMDESSLPADGGDARASIIERRRITSPMQSPSRGAQRGMVGVDPSQRSRVGGSSDISRSLRSGRPRGTGSELSDHDVDRDRSGKLGIPPKDDRGAAVAVRSGSPRRSALREVPLEGEPIPSVAGLASVPTLVVPSAVGAITSAWRLHGHDGMVTCLSVLRIPVAGSLAHAESALSRHHRGPAPTWITLVATGSVDGMVIVQPFVGGRNTSPEASSPPRSLASEGRVGVVEPTWDPVPPSPFLVLAHTEAARVPRVRSAVQRGPVPAPAQAPAPFTPTTSTLRSTSPGPHDPSGSAVGVRGSMTGISGSSVLSRRTGAGDTAEDAQAAMLVADGTDAGMLRSSPMPGPALRSIARGPGAWSSHRSSLEGGALPATSAATSIQPPLMTADGANSLVSVTCLASLASQPANALFPAPMEQWDASRRCRLAAPDPLAALRTVLVSGSDDGSVWIWDVEPLVHERWATDGPRWASSPGAGSSRATNGTELAPIRRIPAHRASVRCMAVYVDGDFRRSMARGAPGVPGSVGSQSLGSGVPAPGSMSSITGAAITSGVASSVTAGTGGSVGAWARCSGLRLVTGASDGSLRVWAPSERRAGVSMLKGHSGAINAVVVLPGAHQMLSCSADKTIRLWDLRSGVQRARFDEHFGAVQAALVIPPALRRVALSESADAAADHAREGVHVSYARVLTTSSGAVEPDGLPSMTTPSAPSRTLRTEPASAGDLDHSPLLATQVLREPTRSAHSSDVQPRSGVELEMAMLASVSASLPDESGERRAITSAASAASGSVLGPGQGRMVSSDFHSMTSGLSVAAEGGVPAAATPCMLSVSRDGSVKVWAATGSCLHSLRDHRGAVQHLALAPTPVAPPLLPPQPRGSSGTSQSRRAAIALIAYSDAAVASGGGHAISAGTDGCLRVWDVGNGRLVQTMRGHRAAITGLVWGAASQALTGSADGTLRLWDLRSGECVQMFPAGRRAAPGGIQPLASTNPRSTANRDESDGFLSATEEDAVTEEPMLPHDRRGQAPRARGSQAATSTGSSSSIVIPPVLGALSQGSSAATPLAAVSAITRVVWEGDVIACSTRAGDVWALDWDDHSST